IREIVPGRQHYPLLRLAQPLDAGEHRKGDEVLDELLDWATTVVRLPLKTPSASVDLLSSDMRSFPSQFLLFIPHVQQLALDDRVAATHRNLRVSSDRDSVITLEDGATTERWVV